MGLYDLPQPSLLDDEDDLQTRSLAALAAQSPELNPTSQLAPPEPVDPMSFVDYGKPEDGLDPEPVDPTPVAAAALATANNPPPAAAPAPSTYQAPEPPAQPDPLEALMQRGNEDRQKALDMYGSEEPGVNGWAVLADVVFNKGRSIPGILSQADADKRQWREGRAKLLTGGGAHSDPVNQMLALERIKTGQGNLAERQKAAQTKADKAAADKAQGITDRDAIVAGYRAMGVEDDVLNDMANASPATFKTMRTSLDARARTSAEGREREAALTRDKAEAGTHARNVTNADDAELLEDASYGRGRGNYRAQSEFLPEKPETPGEKARREREDERFELQTTREAARDARQAERDRKLDERMGNTETRLDQNDRVAFNDKYNKATDSAVKVAQSVGVLEDSLAANPGMFGSDNNLGEGILGELVGDKNMQRIRGARVKGTSDPEKKKQLESEIRFRDNYLKASAFSLKDATGLSGNLTEQEQNTIRTGAAPGATRAEMEAGIEIMARDAKTKLSREGLARPDIADENLTASGLDPIRWAPGLKRGQKKAPAQPVAAAPADDEELGPGERTVINEEGDEVIEGPGIGDEGEMPSKPPARRSFSGKSTRPASADGGDLGTQKGLPPKVPVAAPKTIGGNDSGAPLLKFFVNGKPRMITQEQAEWLIANKPGIEVTQ